MQMTRLRARLRRGKQMSVPMGDVIYYAHLDFLLVGRDRLPRTWVRGQIPGCERSNGAGRVVMTFADGPAVRPHLKSRIIQ
jgi:hypothetical protein